MQRVGYFLLTKQITVLMLKSRQSAIYYQMEVGTKAGRP